MIWDKDKEVVSAFQSGFTGFMMSLLYGGARENEPKELTCVKGS